MYMDTRSSNANVYLSCEYGSLKKYTGPCCIEPESESDLYIQSGRVNAILAGLFSLIQLGVCFVDN